MTHDPLCEATEDPPLGRACPSCLLIAQVVMRERKAHSERTQHLRDRIERLIVKANRWRDEAAELRKQVRAQP